MTMSMLAPLTPAAIVLFTALLLLMFEVYSSGEDRRWSAMLSVVGCSLALFATFSRMNEPPMVMFGSPQRLGPIVVDTFAQYSWALMIAGALVTSLISPAYLKNAGAAHAEYYALVLLALFGMMVMAAANDLFTLFLGIEIMSIAVYVLTGLRRNDPRAAEAALKYFLMGAFATGFLLFGIALVFGATGSVALKDVAMGTAGGMSAKPLLALGIVLLLIGLAFKIAAVPFHLWAPDVYEGAPTPVTGFMAVGVKAAAFVGLLRLVVVGLGTEGATGPVLVPMLSALAYLTIIVGNILAAMQRNVKRMLAYSSISHAGYAMIGIVAAARGEPSAGAAVLFYLLGYTFTTLGAFGVLTFLERKDSGAEAERFGAFAGVGFRHPALGMAMSLFMVALAGMPPTAGFFGKLYVFSAALRAGDIGLVIAGVIGSIISVYYYLRVIVAFYMRDVPDPGPLPTATRSRGITLGLALASIAVVYLGVFPGRWIDLGKLAMQSLKIG